MAKGYNFIYDQLVDSEDDIHGIISYSVYKRQKIQFIKDFKAKNDGNDPSEGDLKPFNDLSMSDAQLEFYKSEATVLTQSFLENVLEADLKEREAYFSARVHAELSNIKPRHFLDIFKGALGSLLFVILTGALYFAVWSLSTSPKMVIEQVFDVQITSVDKSEG
ncbi:hypothetical protein P3592_15805 [Vibrio parahaemolyticus]|nr:hypothetical protein [Vibrio parahaemolyticus]MDF4810599.1 hypothetical protein [Vibrio parahaemolyticus]MDF4853246.1 hypothetical protein [Vibrio parahaemolyticus]HCG5914074.1 hypothetical protein [Vibrio parahaemolyticus]HCG8032795.1 hypothetical protein [Vibrio parahaemolyticus]